MQKHLLPGRRYRRIDSQKARSVLQSLPLFLPSALLAWLLLASTYFAALTTAQAAASPPPPTPPVLYSPHPIYPVEARRHHLQGSGSFVLTIQPDGTVSHVDTRDKIGAPLLDEATVTALSQWRFAPGAARTLRVPITFTMERESPSAETPGIAAEDERTFGESVEMGLAALVRMGAAIFPVSLFLLGTILWRLNQRRPFTLVMLILASGWLLIAMINALVTSPFFPLRDAVMKETFASVSEASARQLFITAIVVLPSFLEWILFVGFATLLAVYFATMRELPAQSTDVSSPSAAS